MNRYDAARRKTWTGLTARLREALKEGPKTIQELADALGVERNKVARMMAQMTGRTGSVIPCPDEPGKYELFSSGRHASKRIERSGGGSIAGRIEIRGYRWPGTGFWRGKGAE